MNTMFHRKINNIFLVSFDNKTLGNVFVPLTLQSHNHEEADTLMILHALTIPKDAQLDVKSPDTDVFFLLVHIYCKLPAETSFVVGDGSMQKKRSVGEFYSVLGENYARALLGFHAFKGSDMTGKFAGRSKKACLKVFSLADELILDALALLGQDNFNLEKVLPGLERFVCLLYQSKTHQTVSQFWWFMYAHNQCKGEKLLPRWEH